MDLARRMHMLSTALVPWGATERIVFENKTHESYLRQEHK
jgi:hypothetical protein